MNIKTVYNFRYNPAPSVLHHPQTTLRDPAYWKMIERVLKYIWDYRNTLEPIKLTDYETDEYKIVKLHLSNITTGYKYYSFNINEALNEDTRGYLWKSKYIYAAKQRRLKHEPFSINITMESKVAKNVIVRLFMGPYCNDIEECLNNYSKFFEIDVYEVKIHVGKNVFEWSAKKSNRLSDEEAYNLENKDILNFTTKQQEYNIFKFPETLLIPKGTEKGMKFKLFVMVTDSNRDYDSNNRNSKVTSIYKQYHKNIYNNIDNMPLGFPFHRKASAYTETANNYRFTDINIYHKKNSKEKNIFFDENLY